MKNCNEAPKELKELFVELVKIELSSYKLVSLSMLENTVKHFSSYHGFNEFPIEYWHCVCSLNGIKYSL
jgi:hypothetical protein